MRLALWNLVLLFVLTGGTILAAQPQQTATTVYLPLVVTPGAPLTGLDPLAATYLGSLQTDQLNAAAVTPDGSLVVAGALPDYAPAGITPVVLPGTGTGAIMRLAPDGQRIRSLTRLGGVVNDLEVNASGTILACGDFGIAALNSNASALIWSADIGSTARCAVGSDGTAAALTGNTVHVFDAAGQRLQDWSVANTANDIAVAGAQGLVIVTGYVQISGNLQIPFIRAWGYEGALRWKSYDFPAGTPNLGTADTRGEQIAIGADGKLYFAASINGGTGVSVVSRDPQDTSKDIKSRTVETDNYTRPTNIGSVKMAWFGRFDPATGQLELAQSLLTRLSSGKGNSISILALTADAAGNVFIAGNTSCCIANRNSLTFAGQSVGNYESGEAYFLVLSSDFRQRLTWTAFAAPNTSAGGSPARGVAVGDGVVVVSATFNPAIDKPRGLITHNALQTTAADAEGYVVVWQTR